jgi:hypothetical protein
MAHTRGLQLLAWLADRLTLQRHPVVLLYQNSMIVL